MDWKTYFARMQGLGVLSTADTHGHVDSALYARPLVLDEETVAFIATPRLTYRNLQENPHAVYLFVEEGTRHRGYRFYLTKIDEAQATHGCSDDGCTAAPDDDVMLVTFRLESVRPLVGDSDLPSACAAFHHA